MSFSNSSPILLLGVAGRNPSKPKYFMENKRII